MQLLKRKTHTVHDMDPQALVPSDVISMACGRLRMQEIQLIADGNVNTVVPNTHYVVSAIDPTFKVTLIIPEVGEGYANSVDPSLEYIVADGDRMVFDVLSGDVTITTTDGLTSHNTGVIDTDAEQHRLSFVALKGVWYMEISGSTQLQDSALNRRNRVYSVFANISPTQLSPEYTGDVNVPQITYNGVTGLFWRNLTTPITEPGPKIVFLNGELLYEMIGFEWVPFTINNVVAVDDDVIAEYRLFIPGSLSHHKVVVLLTTDLTDSDGRVLKIRIEDGDNILSTDEKLALTNVLATFPTLTGRVTSAENTILAHASAIDVLQQATNEGVLERQQFLGGVTLVTTNITLDYGKLYTPANASRTLTLPDGDASHLGNIVTVRTEAHPCIIANSADSGNSFPTDLLNGELRAYQVATFVRVANNWICHSRASTKFSGELDYVDLTAYDGTLANLTYTATTGSRTYERNKFAGVGLVGANILELFAIHRITNMANGDTQTTITYIDSTGVAPNRTETILRLYSNNNVTQHHTTPVIIPWPRKYDQIRISLIGVAGGTELELVYAKQLV
jgi:hypothetical protein